MGTYNKWDFYHNWEEVNKNLGERWDEVLKNNPHKLLKSKTLTDHYFTKTITRDLDKWLPRKRELKLLKYDLYNEATTTPETSLWFLKRGYQLYGVDISKEVVKLAKKKLAKKTNTRNFKVGDIRDLPFINNFFDIVYSFGTIEHIRENEKAVSEAYRVLKPGGVFITGVNNKLDIWLGYLLNELTSQVLKNITSYEASFFPWEQREWLKKVGFEKITTTGMILFPHWLRFADLYLEWKDVRGPIRFIWDNILIRPLISLALFLDSLTPIKRFGVHTTSIGYKPIF